MLNDEIMRAVLDYNEKIGFLDDLNPEKCDLQKYIALYPNVTDEELMGPLYFMAAIPPELRDVITMDDECVINNFLTRERIKNARAHHARIQKECLADMIKLSYEYKDLVDYIETNLKPRIEAANKKVEELDNYQKSLPHGFATKKEGKAWLAAIDAARHERTELESELIYHEAELNRLKTKATMTRDMGTGDWQRAREEERRAFYDELRNGSNGTTQEPEIIGVGDSAAPIGEAENSNANDYDYLYKCETNVTDSTPKKPPVILIVALCVGGSLVLQFFLICCGYFLYLNPAFFWFWRATKIVFSFENFEDDLLPNGCLNLGHVIVFSASKTTILGESSITSYTTLGNSVQKPGNYAAIFSVQNGLAFLKQRASIFYSASHQDLRKNCLRKS